MTLTKPKKPKKYHEPYRYDPRSKINTEKRRLSEKRQSLERDGLDWENAEHIRVLDGWLVHGWFYTSPDLSVTTFQSELLRSYDAVFTMLRKLAINYNGVLGALDNTGRIVRRGLPFTDRDAYLIHLATGPAGRKYGGCRIELIAKLLRRSVSEVRVWLKKITAPQRGMGWFSVANRKAAAVLSDEKLARRVHAILNECKHDFGRVAVEHLN